MAVYKPQQVQATTYLKMRSTDQVVTARKEDKTRTEFAISQYRKYSSRKSPDWST